jgi:hypothetical protein
MTSRRQQQTCTCAAYSFPHRAGSGKCGKHDYCGHGVDRAAETCYTCEPPDTWQQDWETGEWIAVYRRG